MKSRKPKKQRKMLYSKPLHRQKESVNAHLNKSLRKELGKRSLPIRKGDTVKVMRGKNRNAAGKVTEINRKRGRVFMDSLKRKKSDGKEIFVSITASNLLLTELNRDDEKRFKRQKSVKAGKSAKREPAQKKEKGAEKQAKKE